MYLRASCGEGSGTLLGDNFLSVFNRRATSLTKVEAISRKPVSGILSVTQLIPDSEQMDRYDFGPVLISKPASASNRLQTMIFPIGLVENQLLAHMYPGCPKALLTSASHETSPPLGRLLAALTISVAGSPYCEWI